MRRNVNHFTRRELRHPIQVLAVSLLVTSMPASAAGEEKPASPLVGTAWKLVKIAYGDDSTHTPDDPEKYTLSFLADSRVVARIDCNRGNGTWKSPEPGRIEFGLMATTRAMCPPGSLHDRVVRDLPNFRSYLLKDGKLFLSLMADGGIYEFEPFTPPPDRP
jgi:heat shock protein HslJ